MNLRVAGHVRYQPHEHGGVVILDVSRGEWVVLNRAAGELWGSWATGAEAGDAVRRVIERYPRVPEAVIRSDAERLLAELLRRRYVVSADSPGDRESDGQVQPVPDSGAAGRGVGAAMAASGPGGPRSLAEWCRAVLALVFLAAADLLLRCSFPRTVALVRWSRGGWCRSSVHPDHAVRTVEAVRQAARWYPRRAACLERSLAAVLLVIAARGSLDWCLGAAPDPYRFHAWVAVHGEPVPAADDDPLLGQWDLILNV